MSRLLSAALLGAALVPLPAAAASLSNGNFDGGLSGWQSLGDASVSGGQLWLTSASVSGDDDYPLAAGTLNRSGTGAVSTWDGQPEALLGLTPGALGDLAYEGSFAWQSFAIGESSTLSFQWNLATSDTGGDLGFFVLDGQLFTLATSADAALAGLAGFSAQTGASVYEIALTAGAHTLGFGVVDVGDTSVSSALLVGSVQVSPVPEPGALALMLAGLGLTGVAGRRQRHRS